jgi:pimeloyl-ACP methyl ester carboxylesterase
MTKVSDIHITRWGQAGEKLILIHGGVQGSKQSGSAHFSKQEQLAQHGYEVLVPDRPGHGRSPTPNRPDDAEADGEWVAELLGDGAHLVGHSFGGCVALSAASRRPSAVKTLTLIEPGMQALAVNRLPVLLFLLRMLATLKLSFSAEQRIKRFSKLMHIPDAMGGVALNRKEYEGMGQAVSVLKVPTKETLERQLLQLRKSNIPLLVVTGGWSAGIDITADVVAKLGNGKRVTIPSPHHFPQVYSDDFNALLIQFMHETQH